MKHFIVSLIVVAAFFSATVTASFAADAGADVFKAKCASCHGADGKGDTAMGKNLKLKDLGAADVQKASDPEITDVIAKGNEVELNYNPTRFWTVAASVTQTQSITANVSASVQQWIDQRLPIWTSIKDPRGADHIANMSRPEEFNAIVSSFLQQSGQVSLAFSPV